MNIKGESGFVADTLGPITFDGSFVGFTSSQYVNVTGGENAFLSTTETVALSGDSLDVNANRFILNSAGDMFINTDTAIHGTALRAGINSLAHMNIRV